MQFPTSTQTVFNFSGNRMLQELDPIYQLDHILASADILNLDFTRGSILPVFLDLKSDIQQTIRGLVNSPQYVDYNGSLVGYSVISIVSYIAESRLSKIQSTDPMFDIYTKFIYDNRFEIYEASNLSRFLYPSEYISNYPSITMGDISRMLITTSIDDIAPSSLYCTSSMYIYDEIFSYLNNSLASSAWTYAGSQFSYFSYLQSSVLSSVSSASIMNDLSAFLGTSHSFYSRVSDYFISSIVASSDMSASTALKIHNSITISIPSVLFPKLNTYFTNHMASFLTNTIARYLDMFTHYHANKLTVSSINTGSLTAPLPESEYVLAKVMEEIASSKSDTLFSIADVVSDLSENSVDFLNHTSELYRLFVNKLDQDIDNYVPSLSIPSQLTYLNSSDSISISSYLDSYFSSISFSTTDPINSRLLDSAIALELSSVISVMIGEIFASSTDFVKMYAPIDKVFSSSFDIGMSTANRASKFTTILTSALNYELLKNINTVVPSFTANFKASVDYTAIVPVAQFNTVNWVSKYNISDQSKKTITRILLASYYNYKMCASIDSFSNTPLKT